MTFSARRIYRSIDSTDPAYVAKGLIDILSSGLAHVVSFRLNFGSYCNYLEASLRAGADLVTLSYHCETKVAKYSGIHFLDNLVHLLLLKSIVLQVFASFSSASYYYHPWLVRVSCNRVSALWSRFGDYRLPQRSTSAYPERRVLNTRTGQT